MVGRLDVTTQAHRKDPGVPRCIQVCVTCPAALGFLCTVQHSDRKYWASGLDTYLGLDGDHACFYLKTGGIW